MLVQQKAVQLLTFACKTRTLLVPIVAALSKSVVAAAIRTCRIYQYQGGSPLLCLTAFENCSHSSIQAMHYRAKTGDASSDQLVIDLVNPSHQFGASS